MGGGIELTGLLEQGVPIRTWRKPISLFAHLFSPHHEPLFQWNDLLETTPLHHGAAPSFEQGGSANAVDGRQLRTN
jgi:hypothetical protein